MLSLAQRNQRRKRAALESAAATPVQTMEGATAYEHQMMQLNQDRLRLRQIQSEQGKAELKKQLIPAYEPYISGVLDAGNGAQDEVLTTLMIWCIDAEDYDQALNIGGYVLKHNLKMPDRFARTTGCLLAEEVANGALKKLKAGEHFDLNTLTTAMQLTAEHDMPDEARAKLHLAIGKVSLSEAEANPDAPDLIALEHARANLTRAIDLHSSCGGKKDLEKADRLLKKHAPSEPPVTDSGEPSAN